jgi:hypothetical protein
MVISNLQKQQFTEAVKRGVIKDLYRNGKITEEQFIWLMKLHTQSA